MDLSYWVTLTGPTDVMWEGMVYAREENGQLRVNIQESDPIFIHTLKTQPNLQLSWKPAWEDITNERRLPSGSKENLA